MEKKLVNEETRTSYRTRIAPIVKRLCSYIVPRARIFPSHQVRNVPRQPPFDSPVGRITGALRRYAEQIEVPRELINQARVSADVDGSISERAVIRELVENEIAQYERHPDRASTVSAWRVATHALVLERLGYSLSEELIAECKSDDGEYGPSDRSFSREFGTGLSNEFSSRPGLRGEGQGGGGGRGAPI